MYDFAEKYSIVETNQSIIQYIEDMMFYINESVIAECHGSNYSGLSVHRGNILDFLDCFYFCKKFH